MVKGHIKKSQMEKSQIVKTQMDRSQMAKSIGLSQMAGMEGEDFPLVLSPYLRAQFPLGEGKGGDSPSSCHHISTSPFISILPAMCLFSKSQIEFNS